VLASSNDELMVAFRPGTLLNTFLTRCVLWCEWSLCVLINVQVGKVLSDWVVSVPLSMQGEYFIDSSPSCEIQHGGFMDYDI
jgi:hypothetical protein